MHELRQSFPVVGLLKVVGLARSTFYAWDVARKVPDKYAQTKELIKQVYDEHKGRYGYRRIADALREHGVELHANTILRLMGMLSLKSIQRVRQFKTFRGKVGVVAPNLLERNFDAEAPNQKWATDVTEFKVGSEKLYLSTVKDLCTREIVAHEMSLRPTMQLVVSMLKKALATLRQGETPTMHSDQGWHYQMSEYRNLLSDHNVVQSMSRKGNCLDNASMESFFAVLKTECFHRQSFPDAKALRATIDEYIGYYNTKRISTALGGLTPLQCRI
ncbi:IS3 family transposase, partial [Cellvibrio sp. OA-2007]|uniref:IS3 family transposase n=1 Tax=Cellvibrio sp. OA-2007 TaxID=529823 RepID=UPI000B228AB4